MEATYYIEETVTRYPMQQDNISFYSDQITLRGSLYYPDGFDSLKSYPAVVVCSGYTGLNAIYPLLFAGALVPKGFVVLGFDYRGCGESDGPRGRLLLEEQVRDIRNGVTFLKYQQKVKTKGIGLLGWAMGAGLVVQAAEKNEDVKAIAGINGFYNGESFLRSSFSEADYRGLLMKMEQARKDRVFTGKYRLTDPFEVYPLDPETNAVVDERLRPVKHYNIQTSFELAESLYLFDALAVAARLHQPIFAAHGRRNKLHPPALSEELKAAVPSTDFYPIDGKHNDFMTSDDPEFKKLTEKIATWFSARL